jgi:FkbM family methyltransferase
MKENLAKQLLRKTFFRPGVVRRIRFGALAGMSYRVGEITGMSAWYSGPERAHHSAFLRLIRPGDNVVDIGANWGAHSLLFSKLVGSEGSVTAVEPLPAALSELRWHLDTNRCQNVRVRSCAISNKIDSATFTSGRSAYTGRLESVRGAPMPEGTSITVAAMTLDALVRAEALSAVRLVKIDVEGAESLVLEGATETMSRLRPYLVIDLHTPEQDVVVAKLLLQQHYSLTRLGEPPIKRFDVGWPDRDGVWGSILASPK